MQGRPFPTQGGEGVVASAGLTAQTIEASGSREQFEPTTLQPADFDRIREYELNQPPGNPRGN